MKTDEAKKDSVIRWTCERCKQSKDTNEIIVRMRCSCGRWMQWERLSEENK